MDVSHHHLLSVRSEEHAPNPEAEPRTEDRRAGNLLITPHRVVDEFLPLIRRGSSKYSVHQLWEALAKDVVSASEDQEQADA